MQSAAGAYGRMLGNHCQVSSLQVKRTAAVTAARGEPVSRFTPCAISPAVIAPRREKSTRSMTKRDATAASGASRSGRYGACG